MCSGVSYQAARWCWWCASCWTTPRRDARPRRCTFLRPGRSPSSASAWRKAGSSRHPEGERKRRRHTTERRRVRQTWGRASRTNIFDWPDCGLERVNKVRQITIILSREQRRAGEYTQPVGERERNTREEGQKVLFWTSCAKCEKRDRVTGQETLATSATQIERQKYLPVPGPRRTVPPPQSPRWSVFTWAVIPATEHTSTQVNNPDNTVNPQKKDDARNNTLLTQHIMRWQGRGMNCWHKNSSTIMR